MRRKNTGISFLLHPIVCACLLAIFSLCCTRKEHGIPDHDRSTLSATAIDSLLGESDGFYHKGHYANALNALTEAVKIAGQDSMRQYLPIIYNNIGRIYCVWNHDASGIEYFKKGLEIADPQKDESTYRKLLINIQGAAFNINDLDMMEHYYMEMCNLSPKDEQVQYFIYFNKGLILKCQGEGLAAIGWFGDAARYAESHSLTPFLISSAYGEIADAYETSLPAKARGYWLKSIANGDTPPFFKRTALKHLADLSIKLGDEAHAVSYTKQYLELSDSLFKERDMNRARDAQILYERDLDRRKIMQLDMENRTRATQIDAQIKIISITVPAAILLALMSILLQRQKKRLHQSYKSLFERNRNILRMQEIDRQQRLDLEKRIEELEQNAAHEESPAQPKRSLKVQSVDKLSEERRQEIVRAIETVLDDTETICDCDFSIERLADLTGVNSRYLSQVINDVYGQNFRTFLNDRRIREVQRRLLDTENYGHYTIQAIVQSMGYKSLSNFNQLFKRHTGVTPSIYHKMAMENASGSVGNAS